MKKLLLPLLLSAILSTPLAGMRYEQNGLLVVEAESQSPGARFDLSTRESGYKGSGYFRGNIELLTLPGISRVSYPIYINSGGTYQFSFRSKIGQGSNPEAANSSFVRLLDSTGNTVEPVPNENVSASGTWYPVYTNVTGSWSHDASNREGDPRSLSWVLESETEYILELSARSMDHLVDRLILWNTSMHALANTTTGKDADELVFETLFESPTTNTNRPQGDFTDPRDILDILDLVYTWQANNLEPHRNQSIIGWKHATFYTAVMQLYRATGIGYYRDLLIDISEDHDWTMLEVNRALWRHADNHLIGETFINLHIEDGYQDLFQVAHVNHIYDRMIAEPWTGRQLYDWCDALFMSPPVWAQLADLNNDPRYLEEMDRLWWDSTDFLYDDEWKLFYRDSNYFNSTEANGKPVFWGRGNGWVIGGLVRILDYLPHDYAGRQAYVDLFVDMMDQIVSLQMPSGGWPSSLLYPERFDFQTEMSGTGFFVYGLAWGINNGILTDSIYYEAAESAWLEMANYVNGDGTIANIQIVAAEPGPADSNPDAREYGYGAFIMAGLQMAEYYNNLPPTSWAGMPVYPYKGYNWVDTGGFMGWIEVSHRPYIYSAASESWFYLEEDSFDPENGTWAYAFER